MWLSETERLPYLGDELPRNPLPRFIEVCSGFGSRGRLSFRRGGSPLGSPSFDEVGEPKTMEARKRSSECQMFHNVPLNGMSFYYVTI